MTERLGKYEVTEVLGKGAMGIVYKAFDPNIRRTVAVKTIRRELVDEDRAASAIARFKNEAQAAGRLAHPGIVGVYEYGEEGDLCYIAMEYVQGNSLREYFGRGTRFEERDVVSIMAQLLDALAYAHEQGVWHRDIKPANIIIMMNGKLKIADFGIARIDTSSLTQVGAIMGTPGYMAPEQYSGTDVDWRADIFSSGVVMYQLLAGAKPFAGTAEQVAYKICYETPAPPSLADPDRASPRFDAVVATALAKKPADRYQTAHAFRAAVLDAYAAPVSPALSEETIITEVIPTTIRIEPTGSGGLSQPHAGTSPSGPSAPSASAPPATGSQPPPGWDAALLKQVEGQLARFVGPVAKVLVKRAAARTADVDALYAELAANLGSADEKKLFAAGRVLLPGAPPRAAAPAQPAGAPGSTSATLQPLPPELVEAAAKKLAAYVGPIAKVVARRAAAQGGGTRQFYLALAESLASDADRTRFLREVGIDG
ncbi:MAG: serine/threonine protein kinase [Burkholderiales bacterium]|nr:serine/threonine protein kinase [Burkholderiales bacterium]